MIRDRDFRELCRARQDLDASPTTQTPPVRFKNP